MPHEALHQWVRESSCPVYGMSAIPVQEVGHVSRLLLRTSHFVHNGFGSRVLMVLGPVLGCPNSWSTIKKTRVVEGEDRSELVEEKRLVWSLGPGKGPCVGIITALSTSQPSFSALLPPRSTQIITMPHRKESESEVHRWSRWTPVRQLDPHIVHIARKG